MRIGRKYDNSRRVRDNYRNVVWAPARLHAMQVTVPSRSGDDLDRAGRGSLPPGAVVLGLL